MNGTTLRITTAAACIAALAAPGSALAKKHRVAHRAAAPAITVQVPHKYDAGGDGATVPPIPAGVRVNLFDPVLLATSLGNQVLTQLGLPPLPTV